MFAMKRVIVYSIILIFLSGSVNAGDSTVVPAYDINGSVKDGGQFGGVYLIWTRPVGRAHVDACAYPNPNTGNCTCPYPTSPMLTGQAYKFKEWDLTGLVCQ